MSAEAGLRTVCGHPRCGELIHEVPAPWAGEEPRWEHVDGHGGPYHEATPARPPEQTLPRDVFEDPARLAAELRRIAAAYGYEVGDSDEEQRTLDRIAGLALAVLIPSRVDEQGGPL